MKKMLFAGILFSVGVISAAETTAATAADTQSINADMQASQPTSSMMMQEAFEKYRKERNIGAYGTPNARGTVYFTGSSSVAVNSASADFIKSRESAYQKAYTDALAQLIMDRYGRELTKVIRQELGDDSTDAQDAPMSLQDAKDTLVRKTEALAEAAIDKKLQEMGVDPSTYADKSPAAKKDLYRNSILNSATQKAFGSAAGCLAVQTFETRTADGYYSIGVVLRSDAICTDIARSLAQKKRPAISRAAGLSIGDALPSDEELLTQFGVRLFFNENGDPTLLSFGQWGSSYRGGNSRQRERAQRHASTQALSSADEQLTNFINSTMRVTNTSVRGEEEVSQMIFGKDGSARQEDVVKFIDKWSKTSETVGYDTMIGRSTVVNKILRHPAGHDVAVVVRMWSFSTLEANTAAIQGKVPQKTAPADPVKLEDAGVRKGRTYDF